MVIDTRITVTILKSIFRLFLFLIISIIPIGTKKTNIGIAGGSSNYNQVYIDGKPHHRMKQTNLVNHVVELVEEYVKNGIKAK